MKAVYKILNNQDKLIMKYSYHIIYYTDLEKVYVLYHAFIVLVLGLLKNSPIPGYPTWIKAYNHNMLSNTKHVSTLPSYVDIINGIFPNLF